MSLKSLIYDILASFRRWGITYVFNINWHGDALHNLAILQAVEEARTDTGIRAYCVLRGVDLKRLGLSGREPYVIVQREPDSGSPPTFFEIHADASEKGPQSQIFDMSFIFQAIGFP